MTWPGKGIYFFSPDKDGRFVISKWEPQGVGIDYPLDIDVEAEKVYPRHV